MTPNELQTFIRTKIPAAEFMQVAVTRAEPDMIEVSAPLAPNSNVHGTLFGGSSAAIGLVAAWSLVYQRMLLDRIDATLVVSRHSMTYLRPVGGSFSALAQFADAQAWPHFTAALSENGKGRVCAAVKVLYNGKEAARLDAEFAASARK